MALDGRERGAPLAAAAQEASLIDHEIGVTGARLVGVADEERGAAKGVTRPTVHTPEAHTERSVRRVPGLIGVALEEAPNGAPGVVVIIAVRQPGIETGDALARLGGVERAVVEDAARPGGAACDCGTWRTGARSRCARTQRPCGKASS